MKPRFYITGHGRHGKDTVAELLSKHLHLSFKSSSRLCFEIFLFERLKDKYGWKSIDEAMDYRFKIREELRDEIAAFNSPDATKLSRLIFEQHDIYVGIRTRRELLESLRRNVGHFAIWVDRSEHLPDDPSCEIRKEDCTFIIDNNGALSDLQRRVYQLSHVFKYQTKRSMVADMRRWSDFSAFLSGKA